MRNYPDSLLVNMAHSYTKHIIYKIIFFNISGTQNPCVFQSATSSSVLARRFFIFFWSRCDLLYTASCTPLDWSTRISRGLLRRKHSLRCIFVGETRARGCARGWPRALPVTHNYHDKTQRCGRSAAFTQQIVRGCRCGRDNAFTHSKFVNVPRARSRNSQYRI